MVETGSPETSEHIAKVEDLIGELALELSCIQARSAATDEQMLEAIDAVRDHYRRGVYPSSYANERV